MLFRNTLFRACIPASSASPWRTLSARPVGVFPNNLLSRGYGCFTAVLPTKCFRTREGCRRGLVSPLFLPIVYLVYTPLVSSCRRGAPRSFPSPPRPYPCPALPAHPLVVRNVRACPSFFSFFFCCLTGRLQENPNGCARVEVLSESSTTARTGRITRTLVRAAEKLGTADGGDAGGSGAGRGGLGGGGSQQSQQVRVGVGGGDCVRDTFVFWVVLCRRFFDAWS